mgnify:CR=1 FL=1|jgi:hypothetical protein|tara:strand:- start:347 stop:685 length:339 start_codon:yes stop_codon:yes gene_type:complete
MTTNILEHLWVLFIGLGSWALNRITGKIDTLEKEKADGQATKLEHQNMATLVHELDRRVDENQHMSVGRGEHKSDVTALHIRVNELERNKADKIRNIRTHQAKDKGENSNGQ